MTASTMAAAAAFQASLRVVLKHEGGYADNPTDPGGATNMGITHKTLAEWRGRPVSKADVRALAVSEATAIYQQWYWGPSGAALCTQYGHSRLALLVFDWGVNGGVGRATRYLQAALNGVLGSDARILLGAQHAARSTPLVVDGKLGPKSRAALAAIDAVDELAVCGHFQQLRWMHHRLRSGVDVATTRAQLLAAGISAELLPTPNPEVREPWLRIWGNRQRANAIACGLPPFPPRG